VDLRKGRGMEAEVRAKYPAVDFDSLTKEQEIHLRHRAGLGEYPGYTVYVPGEDPETDAMIREADRLVDLHYPASRYSQEERARAGDHFLWHDGDCNCNV